MQHTKLLIIAAMALTAFSGVAKNETKEFEPVQSKQTYTFKHPEAPRIIRHYSSAPLVAGFETVRNARGYDLSRTGKGIVSFAINPTNLNYTVVSINKIGKDHAFENVAEVYSQTETGEPIMKFNKKKYGQPWSAAYTPDARTLIIGTDAGLQLFDASTLKYVENLPIDILPLFIEVSSNGYFAAISDGNKVLIYNLENRKPRTTLDFSDPDIADLTYDTAGKIGTMPFNKLAFAERIAPVTDVKFNKDATEMGVLTTDGVLTIYDTRSFMPKKTISDMPAAIAFDYNFDGKYVAVISGSTDKSEQCIEIINLLNPGDRKTISGNPTMRDLCFLLDSKDQTLLFYSDEGQLVGERMSSLLPYYRQLIDYEANEKLNEWLKMMPGESLDDYKARVNDQSRADMLRYYEDEASTRFAQDLVSLSSVSLGKYDTANQVLEVGFDNMPTIYLPVPEGDLGDFRDVNDLEFRNAKYGVMNDDKFELIYAEVYNRADGKTYVYNNIDRTPLNFEGSEDNVIDLEVLQLQQLESLKLQEIKQNVVEEAKSQNVISDHTNIAVDSRVEPSYDSDGNKIINYRVKFTYEVDPQFTVYEDFAPGKYRADQSGAANSMLRIIKEAFEGEFAQYLREGKKVLINISGTADASPIVGTLIYDGAYGDFNNEPVHKGRDLTTLSIKGKERIQDNEHLAFLRAAGVRDFLHKNVNKLNEMNTDYQFFISVADDKGSQFRRITTEFIFVDAF